MDIVFQMIFDFVFCWPGAAIRWLFYRGTRSFKVLIEDVILNSAVGAMGVAVVVGIIYSISD